MLTRLSWGCYSKTSWLIFIWCELKYLHIRLTHESTESTEPAASSYDSRPINPSGRESTYFIVSYNQRNVGFVCITCSYGVATISRLLATISRLLKIIGLFCRISTVLWGSFAKETCDFKGPTNRSHPIAAYRILIRHCDMTLDVYMSHVTHVHRILIPHCDATLDIYTSHVTHIHLCILLPVSRHISSHILVFI